MKQYVLATPHKRNEAMRQRLNARFPGQFTFIRRYEDLKLRLLSKIDPRYIFFPHWSQIIPEEIHSRFECVIFHMTDVPFGRGGSPLQNLVARGLEETTMTALRCVSQLDAGPVYLKKPLSLLGSAEEILLRASGLIAGMIEEIVAVQPSPVEQSGEVTTFARRTPAQSDASELTSLGTLFDHIRMLDAEGYPPAFLRIGSFKLMFSRASLRPGEIIADVRIVEADGDE